MRNVQKFAAAIALGIGVLMIANASHATEKTPGYVWMMGRAPSSLLGEEKDNFIIEAGAQQALILYSIMPKTDIRTYVLANIGLDKERFDYNNKISGSLGAEVVYQPNYAVRLAVGARYEWEDYHVTGRTFGGAIGYVAADYIWREYGKDRQGWFVQGQSEIRYPGSLEPREKNSLYARGSVETGYVFWQLARDLVSVGAFGSGGVKADTKQIDRYNTVELSACTKVFVDLHEHAWLEIGGGYQYETRWVSDTERNGAVAFMKLVTWW